MAGAGRLGDKASIQSDAHGCPGCPHPGVGPAIIGSPTVSVNGRPALRVDDIGLHAACCGPNMWKAKAGASNVYINGKQAFRLNDATQHCGGTGKLIEGSADVIIGDAGGGGGGGGGSGGGSSGGSSGGSGGRASGGGGGGASSTTSGAGAGGGGATAMAAAVGPSPLASSAAAAAPAASGTGELVVHVVSAQDGTAASHASVSLSGPASLSGTSDANGDARFSGIAVGMYQIKVTAAHFDPLSGLVASVGAGMSKRIVAQLTPEPATLSITVVDKDTGVGIADAQITLSGASSQNANTDGSGGAATVTVPPGQYRVEATHDLYADGDTDVMVQSGQTRQVRITVPKALEIVDASGNVLTGTQTVIVGEPVDLTVRSVSTTNALQNPRWQRPAKAVASYLLGARNSSGNKGVPSPPKTATKTALTDSDLSKDKLKFHWIDAWTGDLQVEADVHGSKGRKKTTLSFQVLAPTAPTLTGTVAPPLVSQSGTTIYLGSGPVAWTGKATAPAAGAGHIAIAQLIKRKVMRLNSGNLEKNETPGFVADAFPYDWSNPPVGKAIAAGSAATAPITDQPGLSLDGGVTEQWHHDKFQTFLMYQPQKPGSIWVMLARADWEWEAKAVVDSSASLGWSIMLKSPTATISPPSVLTSDLPEWADMFDNYATAWTPA